MISEFPIIGIDNGLSGALVAMSPHPKIGPIESLVMPTIDLKKGRMVDIEAVLAFLDKFLHQDPIVILERPGGSKSARAGIVMQDTYASIRTLLIIKRIKWASITPQKWQNFLLSKERGSGESKLYAAAKAKELWPNHNFLATPRSKKPHEGILDAALIAEYARIQTIPIEVGFVTKK